MYIVVVERKMNICCGCWKEMFTSFGFL